MNTGPVGAIRSLLDRRLPPAGTETAFLGLGGNIGDRLGHLSRAVECLHDAPGVDVRDVSSVYETEPVGVTLTAGSTPEADQDAIDAFYNIAIRVDTTLSPTRLLAVCQQIETSLGRERPHRWAPRIIDIDILLYGDRELDHPVLQVPHPRLTERAFALVPLMEVAPGWRLPDGRTLASHVTDLAPITGIIAIGRQVALPDQGHSR